MPLWLHPYLRTLQEDEEALGLIPKLNSPPVTQALALEAAALAAKPVLNITRVILGTVSKH
jgi:hypothetical protein